LVKISVDPKGDTARVQHANHSSPVFARGQILVVVENSQGFRSDKKDLAFDEMIRRPRLDHARVTTRVDEGVTGRVDQWLDEDGFSQQTVAEVAAFQRAVKEQGDIPGRHAR
jgi:hypothetical protein